MNIRATIGAIVIATGPYALAGGAGEGIVPDNGSDSCANAPAIGGYGLFPWDNVNATTDGGLHALCTKSGFSGIVNDLWWRWTSPVSGPVTISTCGLSAADSKIAIYSPQAVCAPTDEYLIACDDQTCGNQTEITFLAVSGEEYLIRLGSFGPGFVGAGQFRMSGGGVSASEHAYCQKFDADTSIGEDASTFKVADDFVPLTDSLLTHVTVQGDFATVSPIPDNADSFRVRYLLDNNGVPGAPIAHFRQGVDLFVEGPVLTGELVEGVWRQFEHKFSHPAVPAPAGQRLWVEIRSEFDDWYWSTSTDGNGVCYVTFDIFPYEPGSAHAHDLTFCVGPIVPCPADLNADGTTDFADLNLLLSAYNMPCP